MEQIETDLLTLNYRLTSRALSFWNGSDAVASHYDVYDGFSHILTPSFIDGLRRAGPWTKARRRVFHTLLGHYMQHRISPYENELFTWIKGAAAHINGEKIYFKDILSWCQKRSDLATRRIMEKESDSLCKFLKPFSLAVWEPLLELLEDEFGYVNYVDYCHDKKQVDYESYVPALQDMMKETDTLYFEAMEEWARRSLQTPLDELSRFDAIYLLGLPEFDHLFPDDIPLESHLRFFDRWGIRVDEIPGLHLDIGHSSKKGAQAMSFALRVPQEIHLVMNPQGGWVDLETLFHETGHALAHAFTSPELPESDKDFFTSNTLSETYAFLIQNLCFSPHFLERHLGLSPAGIEEVSYYKALKDMSVFRRYVGKFLTEYEMFKGNDLSDGEAYASIMKKYTGFVYLPESHLFDLVPELYALDYVVSWMAEATMEKWFTETVGHDWMFKEETGKIFKDWWRCGNRHEIDEFFQVKGIGSIGPEDIVERWRSKIGG